MQEEKTVAAHIWVKGRVQGVCFRMAAQECAEQHGVTGWVRNLADGRVEASLLGTREAVEAVIAWCHQGPPAARVDHVTVAWEEPGEIYRNFLIC